MGMWFRSVVTFAFAALLLPDTASADGERGSGAQGARWQNDVVEMVLDPTMDDLDRDALEVLIGAVSAWQVAATDLPTVTVRRGKTHALGYERDAKNSNSVQFAEAGSSRANGALAITVITFDLERGVILDADILLNGEHRFGLFKNEEEKREADGAYDVQNVLTHEMGHFLGLGEDYKNENATMYAYSLPGETAKRDLAQTDAITVSELYGGPPLVSDEQAPEVGCGGATIANRRRAGQGWLLSGLLGLVVAYLARRRARSHAFMIAALGSALLISQPAAFAPTSVTTTVSALDAHWVGGLIITTAELQRDDCTECAPLRYEVAGGVIDGIGQTVGELRPPRIGQRVRVALPR